MQSLTRRRVRRTRSGFDDEVTMLARLSRRMGIPVAGTCASAVRALRLLDARRIALMHPPWFDEELNERRLVLPEPGVRGRRLGIGRLAPDPDQIEPAAVVE